MSRRNDDDSIERFFRKAVSDNDQTFLDSDWKSMEKMLDAEDLRLGALKTEKIKQRSYIIVTATIIFAVVYFLIRDQQQAQSRLLTDGSLVKERAVEGEEAPTSIEKEENPAAATLLPQIQKNTSDVSMSGIKNRVPIVFPAIRVNPDYLDLRINREKSWPIRIEAVKTTSADDAISPGNVSVEVPNTSPDQEEKPAEKNPAKNDLKGESSAITEMEQEKDHVSSVPSRWSISLAVAPDFSTTSLDRYYAPGGALGALLHFQITRRLSVSSGVISTSKQYSGFGSEYNPPEGYWGRRTNGIVPDEIDGECKILEIPVNLQLSVRQTDRSRYFVSGGVSSYRMRSESYDYEFYQPNDGAASGWSSTGPSSYPFSIGHFSAGYDRIINQKLVIGVEPFVKVPFKGIGWSDINLFTTGLYVNLRYRFQKNISKADGLNAAK